MGKYSSPKSNSHIFHKQTNKNKQQKTRNQLKTRIHKLFRKLTNENASMPIRDTKRRSKPRRHNPKKQTNRSINSIRQNRPQRKTISTTTRQSKHNRQNPNPNNNKRIYKNLGNKRLKRRNRTNPRGNKNKKATRFSNSNDRIILLKNNLLNNPQQIRTNNNIHFQTKLRLQRNPAT